MKINLKAKYNSKSLFEVYLDERIWGVLPKKLLIPFFHLTEIDNEDFKELKTRLYNYSRDRLFAYLAKQEHSEYESRIYLKKLKLHKSIIDSIIDFCLDKKFISDERLTELYVRSLIDLGKSKIEIAYKLKNKGIQQEDIDRELELQYSNEAKKTIIEDNLLKAIRVYQGRGDQDIYNKVASYMMRKGFAYSDFSDILKSQINHKED